MAPSHKGIRYGGRKCKSSTGKPAKATGLRMPAEFMEFIESRIAAGDAQTEIEGPLAPALCAKPLKDTG